MMGRASCCWDKREEHGCRGGGAIGAHPSRGLLFRCDDSRAVEVEEEVEDDEEAEATAAAAVSGSRQPTEPEGGEVSGPTAPCSSSPAAACSASRVGDEGGEGRDFFLLEDNSFRRLFFSLCSNKSNIFLLVNWNNSGGFKEQVVCTNRCTLVYGTGWCFITDTHTQWFLFWTQTTIKMQFMNVKHHGHGAFVKRTNDRKTGSPCAW